MSVEVTKATIIDGKATAKLVRAEIAERVSALKERGVSPGLAVVLVGEDPASQIYVRNKDRAADEAGFTVRTMRLDAAITQAELLARVRALNEDASFHGILVQLPLPPGFEPAVVLQVLDPKKDVDGLHPANVGALWRGGDGLFPCTPLGCLELLDRQGVELEGKRAVVLGRSRLVGKPLAALLLSRHATVTLCHSRTVDLAGVAREADVLVAAVGRARLVRRDWVKPGAVVLDVGMNRGEDGKLCGDVALEEVVEVAGAITPVPGGVGPMTIAMLLRNTARAAARSAGIRWDELEPGASA